MQRKILITVLAVCAAYALYSASIAKKAMDFRKLPVAHDFAGEQVKGWAPHNALATAIILHPGSSTYRIETRTIFYLKIGKSKLSPWAKWMLRDDFEDMSDNEFNIFVGSYPGDYKKIHNRIIGNLRILTSSLREEWRKGNQGDEGYEENYGYGADDVVTKASRLINALNRYPTGRAAFIDWYKTTIEAPRERNGFWSLADEICHFEGVDYKPVFKSMVPDQRGDSLHFFDDNIGRLARCAPLTGVAGRSFSAAFQRLGPPGGAIGQAMLPFVGRAMRVGERGLSPAERAAALALVSHSKTCDFSPLFNDTIENETAASDEGKPHALAEIDFNALSALFDRSVQRHDDCAQLFFASIANNNLKDAERVFSGLENAPDTTLRKDMIVQLINNDSRVGMKLIDQAFSGVAPRRAQFIDRLSYIENSKAAAAYKTLAMHDYLETGKEFPPIYKTGGASTAEIGKWTEFVRRYPWFPGADDAYYRLAYAYFATGDDGAALKTMRDYATLERPDQDAEPFMVQLLKAIVDRRPDIATEEVDLAADPLAAEAAQVRKFLALRGALLDHRIADAGECRAFGSEIEPWLLALDVQPSRPFPGDQGDITVPQEDFCDSYYSRQGNAASLKAVSEVVNRYIESPKADE